MLLSTVNYSSVSGEEGEEGTEVGRGEGAELDEERERQMAG